MNAQSMRYVSERDFVAQFLLPKIKESARIIQVSNLLDFHIEKRINGGTADLVVEKGGRGLFLIEAKFKKKIGTVERDIEPRDPEVIRQAVNYAAVGGYPYYITCNAKRLILFQLKPSIKAIESEIASFDYEKDQNWSETLLKIVLAILPAQLKPIHDTLVDILREAFNDLNSEFQQALKEKLLNKKFESRYNEWLTNQGIKVEESTNNLIAEQATYLQLNRIIFYEAIRTIYPQKLRPLQVKENEDVEEALTSFFGDVLKIDYMPIYQKDLLSEIPFTERAKERTRTLLDTIIDFDFSKIESDFIGKIYEKLIPPTERKRLGQFYTPPNVVDLIVKMVVSNDSDVVLDPGCGSGSFLVGTYHRLRELNHVSRILESPLEMRFHQQLLNQLFGIDINQFPAHLTVINLAIQNPKSKIEKTNVAISDFFDVKPRQATLMGFKSVSAEGSSTLVKMPPVFDAIVANPPYIRQELLGDKEKLKIKNLIENEYKDKLFIGNPKRKAKNSIVLGKQSDIYIYFYIHALKFLRNGRRLGYISSNKWLEVGYGRAFQKFLLEHTKIQYIIEFDSAVFPDAEVNTVTVILEKAEGEAHKSARNNTKTKFVHVKKPIPIEQLIVRLQNEEKANDEVISLVTVQQGKLKVGKWNIFLRAPPVYFELLENPLFKPLEKVADVKYGIKSGYDPYFILNNAKVDEWKIENKYLKPCAPPGKLLKGFQILPSHIQQYFLIVHDDMTKLQGTNVLTYLKFGEKSEAAPSKRRKEFVKLPEVETIKGRPHWYSLSEPPTPSLLFPMWFRYRYHPLMNDAKVHATDFYYYIITPESEKEILVAILYSTLTQFLLELGGRQYSGMLHTKVYELKNLPILDTRDFSLAERDSLKKLASQLNNAMIKKSHAEDRLLKFTAAKSGERGLFEKEYKEQFERAQINESELVSQIDKIIYDKLNLTDEQRKAIFDGLANLRALRKSATRGIKLKEA